MADAGKIKVIGQLDIFAKAAVAAEGQNRLEKPVRSTTISEGAISPSVAQQLNRRAAAG